MQAQGNLPHDMSDGVVCSLAKGAYGKERVMRKGDIIVNPWVSTYFNGELNPNYATIYLGDNKSLDYNGRVCEWADKIYKDNPKRNTPWKVIGHIDLYGIAELAIRDAVFAEEVVDIPQIKVSYRECPWCKTVCAFTDKYCHECGWHIADTPQNDLVKDSDDLVKDLVKDTPQTERKCIDCRFLTYMYGKTWCNIKCDNPRDKVCDRFKPKDEQTDCAWR